VVFVHRLVWDNWNIAHIARHQVIPEEVEEVCEGNPTTSQTYAGRIRVAGPTRAGRMLTIILAPKGEEGVYYLVTARSADRKERKEYQQEKGGEK